VSRFPELKGLSILIKVYAALVLVVGVLVMVLSDSVTVRFGYLVGSILLALTYWILARFIDILLQINKNVIELIQRPGFVPATPPIVMPSTNWPAQAAAPGAAPAPAPVVPSSLAAPAHAPVAASPVRTSAAVFQAQVEPSRGSVGTAISVEIVGAVAGSVVDVLWLNAADEPRMLKTIHVNMQGRGRALCFVPDDAQPGPNSVVFESSGRRVISPFMVTS